jgi:hypothetical protein
MGKFLTESERRRANDPYPDCPAREMMYCEIMDRSFWPCIRIRYGPFYPDELKRLISAMTAWFGMFVKRPRDITVKKPNDYISYAIECAEDSGLSVLGVLKVLDDMMRTEKSLPALCDLNTAFLKLAEPSKASFDTAILCRSRFMTASSEFTKTLKEAEDQIRTIVPEFPEADVICAAWEKVMDAPPGLSDSDNLAKATKFVKSLIEGLRAGEYAVAYGLLNLTIAATAPKEKFQTVDRLVVEQRPEDTDAEDWGVDKPEMYRNAVQQAENLPEEYGKDFDGLGYSFYNTFECRKRPNIYWPKFHGSETISQDDEF